MRRQDREVTDNKKIDEIIRACHCCRLGFCDDGEVYLVPMNFGFREQDGKRTFFFHSAKQGRKIDLILQGGSVGFELDTGYHLLEGKNACDYSACYQSVIGTGSITVIEEPEEKKAALCAILFQETGKDDWAFSDAALAATCTFRLEVKTISCKEHKTSSKKPPV